MFPFGFFRERFVDKTVYDERLVLERYLAERQRARSRKGPLAEILVRELRGSLL